jgi:hypothetical protein
MPATTRKPRPLTRVRRATTRRADANDEFATAIRAAWEAGETARAIAAEAGVSHVRVLQIVRGE